MFLLETLFCFSFKGEQLTLFLFHQNTWFLFIKQFKTTAFPIFSSKITLLLTAMKYPFPSGVSAPVFNSKEDNEEQFKRLLTISVKLQSLYLFIFLCRKLFLQLESYHNYIAFNWFRDFHFYLQCLIVLILYLLCTDSVTRHIHFKELIWSY